LAADHLHRINRISHAGLIVTALLVLASCGGGASSSAQLSSNSGGILGPGTLISAPAATGINTVPIVIDTGPVNGASEINVPYVSVTVCTPGGTTAACQTIDHVVLDTGSSGLRLLKSALYSNLNLPAVTTASGLAIGECLPFVIGTTWGAVRYADVYLGGEVARKVPIQDIGDQPGGAAAIPVGCSSYGTIQNTQAQLGSNGILGVGLFKNDCDVCLVTPISAAYYTCTRAGCTSSTVTSTQVVQNPVAIFQQDNNGVLIELPPVSSAGANTSLAGSLIFGIGTQSNNQLGSATVYATDTSGNFSTSYKGSTVTSYVDSGSNALFFNDSITRCSSPIAWVYCSSSSPLTLTATNTAFGGGAAGTFNFTIVNAANLFSNPSVVAGNIGGPSPSQFAWGLPFFFGRPVFTAIQGVIPPAGVPPGPYFAY
jgi:Protein of unknown function (DUF3443)